MALTHCAVAGEPVGDGGGVRSDVPTTVRMDGMVTSPITDTGPIGLDPDAACGMQNFSTNRTPATLLLLVDRSNSMNDRTAAGTTRWDAARNALRRLIMGLPDETRVGLMFFPTDLVAVPAAGDSLANYTRSSVVVAPLAMNRMALIAKLNATMATGRTPMACALPGAIGQLRMLPGMEARHVVLITDGLPTFDCTGRGRCDPADMVCLTEVENLAKTAVLNAARTGAALNPAVQTFTIGTPDASDMFLSSIASNGGTSRSAMCSPSSCHYSIADANFEMQLNQALDAIRGRTATCEYALNMIDPTMADPNLVNVRYRDPMGVERLIPRDRTHMNGWDYSPGMRSIIFYGPVCAEIRADAAGSARVQILYGCPTIMPG